MCVSARAAMCLQMVGRMIESAYTVNSQCSKNMSVDYRIRTYGNSNSRKQLTAAVNYCLISKPLQTLVLHPVTILLSISM